MLAALVLALVLAGDITSRTETVDAVATATALRIRVGERASSWTIELEADGAQIVAHMRHDNGRALDRSFALHGATVEERSRELAAALALVIEQHATDTSPTAPVRPQPTRSNTRTTPAAEGWLALGGRVGVGRPADPDGGLTLRGGALWGRRIVQPLAALGSMHARRDTLQVDGVRVGAGAAFGAPIPGTPLWLGGLVLPQVAWTLARGRGRASGVSAITELAALAQVRTRAVLVALRVGVELAAPPIRARDRDAQLRFGTLRFACGLEIGVRLPTRGRSPR